MKLTAEDRSRLSHIPSAEQISGISHAVKRFEVELHAGKGYVDPQNGDRQRRAPCRPTHFPDVETDYMPSPNVAGYFRESLESEIKNSQSNAENVISNLLMDISDSVRIGRRMSGDRWRLLLRLRPEFLAQSEMEISCVGGEVSVALRTADEQAYRRLASLLPELNATLSQCQVGERRAVLFWVDCKDLSTKYNLTGR